MKNGIIEVDRDSELKPLKTDPRVIKMMDTAIKQNAKILETNIKIINHVLISLSMVAVVKTKGEISKPPER